MSHGRVLIVEDDQLIRMLVRTILEGRGLTVAEAEDGPSAYPKAQEFGPDVVLLDIGLPGMDGFGVLDQIKADPAFETTPVIMVTAWSESNLVAKALDRGAHDFVRKPFQVEELSARVDAALRVKAHADDLADDNRRLADHAGVDVLTALPNRRHMDTVLERQASANHRTGRTFSVVFADVDGFKAVNDEFGHAVGDDVLRAIAKRLRQRARTSDVIGRWGGEEFMVVTPDTDLGGAGALAEDLRTALATEPLDTASAAVRVTASFGVAEYDPAESVEELTARVDAALYAAKDAGRNTVRVAERAPLVA